MEGTDVCAVPVSGTHPVRAGRDVTVEGEVGSTQGRAENFSHGLDSLFSPMGEFCLPDNQRA